MKDIGEAYYIVGVKIHRDHSSRLVALSLECYIKKILEWLICKIEILLTLHLQEVKI